MKLSPALRFLILVVALLPVVGHGALSRQNNLLGKFFVSSVKGDVTCVSDGRILSLKKGDTIMARGAILETKEGATATIVFSNGTGVYTDEKTRFEVEKFDQEFFAPNNNLKVEPSNSSTLVALSTGRVVVSTPRLLSGTTMVYKTAHAAVGIRGEKILIEADEKQTHVAMIAGTATVNVRNPDGTFVSIGKRLTTGQEAFVKYTIGGTNNDGLVLSDESSPAGAASPAAPTSGAAAPVAITAAPEGPETTADSEAVILKVNGSARMKLPASATEIEIVEGAKLPRGTLITTDDASELYLQAFDGAIATLRPNTVLQIEKLSLSHKGATLTKQTALLALKAGTVISTIDPEKRHLNDYGVRTPKGIASAKGTSFAVSIEDDEGFSVAATADIVTFVTPSGDSYSIAAGSVTITPAGGEPQPPIALSAAVAANPSFASVIETALTAVSNVVQNNIGSLPASSATDLLTKVASTASAALPSEAPAIAARVVTAVTSPTSSTASSAGVAAASVTQAIAAAAPTQAAQIATSAALAAPAQSIAIASAAARAAPAQAPQIASAVTQTLVQLDSLGAVTPASVQTASAVAAAVTTSAPNQAAPVAAAVMQAIAQTAPLTPPAATAQFAATIASSVTTAAPSQAVPVAATMMRALTQTTAFADAAPQLLAQTGATLATAVTSVVPPQAQEVATAVMQLLVQAFPNASPAVTAQAAGLLAASVSQVAPDQAGAITQSVAIAANQPLVAVQSSAAASLQQATLITQQVAQITQMANSASQQSSNSSGFAQSAPSSSTTVAQSGSSTAIAAVIDPAATATGGESGTNTSTSIIITQFDPAQVGELTADIEAAQAGVQFTPSTGGEGGGGGNSSPGTVTPIPTIPQVPPVEQTVSPANLSS